MKNIMIVNGYLGIGGAERVLTFLANELCKKYNVYFVTLRVYENNLFSLNSKVKLIELNVEKERKSSREMGVIGTIKYFVKIIKIIKNLVNKLNINLVISFNDRETFLTWFALHNNKNIKLLFSQRNAPSSKLKRTNMFLRYIYHHCNGVVFQLKDVEKFYGLGGEKNSIIIENPNQCNLLEIKKEKKKKIVSAGRLTKQKRFDVLIDAFSIFSSKYEDYILEIYGSGEEKNNLLAQIRLYELNNKVKIMDPISNVMQENSDAEMFVLASDYEGIPNILIEAMSAGIPCISTDCVPGGGDLLTNHGKCGLLVECDNPNRLAEAMILYAENEELRKNNVIRAFEYLKKFDKKNIANKWLNFIEYIID